MAISILGRRPGLHFFALFACLVIGQPGLAHEHEKMCGGVKDGNGNPVLQSDGDILLHAGSAPCPPPPAPDPVTGTIYFDFDIAEPNTDGLSSLARLVDALAAGTPSHVSVEGHADRAGTEAHNLELSRQRAENVATALIGAGVPEGAVLTEYFGETQPAVPTEDGVRNPQNRRAEVELKF